MSGCGNAANPVLPGPVRCGALLIGGALTMAVCILWIDRPLAWMFRRRTFFFDGLASWITHAGDSLWVLSAALLVGALGLLVQRRAAAPLLRARAQRISLACAFVFFSVASSGVLVNALKYAFGRARFNALMLRGEYGFYFFEGGYDFSSFPSGHANTALAVSVALACLWPRARRLFLLAGVLLASSRVVLTAHYLSDALAGGALGWWTTRLWWRWFALRYPLLRPGDPARAGQCVAEDGGGASSAKSWPTSTASKR
ncbi:MAG: phosphatase PAP2 family protein [Pseudomonadota bacterium]|jgi:membrane-associated phospholipid phosphatase